MREPQLLRGMRDFTPEQMIKRQRVMALFREIFESHGFEPIDTPALEYYASLTDNYGDDEKLIYHFQDHGGREIGLRYDLTVPLARFVALNMNELTLPFKRYHIAPVWRADRPQRGRYREFWQCDADIVGTASMVADADVVSILVEALDAINIPDFAVHINHRQLLDGIARFAGVDAEQSGSVYRAIDKLAKIGSSGVIDELVDMGIRPDSAEQIVELVSSPDSADVLLDTVERQLAEIETARQAVQELRDLFGFLAAMGVPEENYELDLSLARGLSYYTGPVYEAISNNANVGSLAGAGRYNGLVGTFMRDDLPATGISLGLERIIDVVDEFGLMDVPTTVSDVMVSVFNKELAGSSLSVTTELRRSGLKVECYLEPGSPLGRQFRYADRRGIPFVVVLGPEEVAQNTVTIRNLGTGEQTAISRDKMVVYLMNQRG